MLANIIESVPRVGYNIELLFVSFANYPALPSMLFDISLDVARSPLPLHS